MSMKRLNNIKPYVDSAAAQKGEPGIIHSYMSSLATAVNHIRGELDPAWLMGSSGFAFRLFVNQISCPSAMSIFPFGKILPEAVEQAGYECIYLERMWNEPGMEESKRNEAHALIIAGLERGVPAICWDLHQAEWGLIVGSDEESREYGILSDTGRELTLPYDKLGHNGINILSVAIPGKPNSRSREELIHNSLEAAVDHAEGREWTDRPEYQNGLAGYDMWASIFGKWAMLVDAGKSANIGADIFGFSRYYSGHHYSARCYARDYLNRIAEDDKYLKNAAQSYGQVADCLKPLWDFFSNSRQPDSESLIDFQDKVMSARKAEEKGIESLKEYLK